MRSEGDGAGAWGMVGGDWRMGWGVGEERTGVRRPSSAVGNVTAPVVQSMVGRAARSHDRPSTTGKPGGKRVMRKDKGEGLLSAMRTGALTLWVMGPADVVVPSKSSSVICWRRGSVRRPIVFTTSDEIKQ